MGKSVPPAEGVITNKQRQSNEINAKEDNGDTIAYSDDGLGGMDPIVCQ